MGTDDPGGIVVDVREDAGSTIVALRGELEFGTAASVRATLSELAQRESSTVVVDLSDLRFIDSIGLSLLVQAKQRFGADGKRFEIRDPAPNVARVIQTSGLAELFALEPHER